MDTKKEGTIYMVRHGAALNEKGAMGGWSEIPLAKQGKSQAEEAAEKLPDNLDGIITSDLERALETAEIISRIKKIPIIRKMPALRSWNIGPFTQHNPEKVEPILDKLANQEPNMSVPGGESFNHYKDRVIEAFEYIKSKYPDKKLAVVTHSHGFRVMRAWEREGMPKNMKIDMKEYNTRATETGGVEKLKI